VGLAAALPVAAWAVTREAGRDTMSTVTSRPKDRTGAARQARYRQRVKARQRPLTEEQWKLIAEMIVPSLSDHPRIVARRAIDAFNRLAAAGQASVRIELINLATR
jgi:hypothetical protein